MRPRQIDMIVGICAKKEVATKRLLEATPRREGGTV
jgi:hypothetical protein